jgi:hypothetical protein
MQRSNKKECVRKCARNQEKQPPQKSETDPASHLRAVGVDEIGVGGARVHLCVVGRELVGAPAAFTLLADDLLTGVLSRTAALGGDLESLIEGGTAVDIRKIVVKHVLIGVDRVFELENAISMEILLSSVAELDRRSGAVRDEVVGVAAAPGRKFEWICSFIVTPLRSHITNTSLGDVEIDLVITTRRLLDE